MFYYHEPNWFAKRTVLVPVQPLKQTIYQEDNVWDHHQMLEALQVVDF
jgi:hypothetical protein